MKKQKSFAKTNYKIGTNTLNNLSSGLVLIGKIIVLFLFFVFSFNTSAQKVITVDFENVKGTVKDLQAGNR